MEKTKSYSISGIEQGTLDLLRDSKARFEREHGVKITFLAFLRSLLAREASAEYERQAKDGE